LTSAGFERHYRSHVVAIGLESVPIQVLADGPNTDAVAGLVVG
jgi:hypothetical protein